MGRDEDAESDDSVYFIERAQVLLCRSESAQGRNVCRIPSSLDIEFFAKPPEILRLVIDYRQHASQEEQITGRCRLDIVPERRGRGGQLNAKVLQPAFDVARLQILRAHHRPTCAPPSTCSTSPVTLWASVR